MEIITDEDISSLEKAMRKEADGSEIKMEKLTIGLILTIALGKPAMPE